MTKTPLDKEESSLHGLREVLGMHLVAWEHDRAVVEMVVDERHLNRSGIVHGGVYAALLDTALGFAACYAPESEKTRRALTLSLTTNFIASVRSGLVRTEAWRVGGGKSIYFGEAEVRDADGQLLASGTGTFKYLKETPQ